MGREQGAVTRQTILRHAAGLASQLGLEGLSIGRLADDLRLPSGLFAHFQSEPSSSRSRVRRRPLVDHVVRPAWPRRAASARARRSITGSSGRRRRPPGGCFFVAASIELDDRPGPVRETLVRLRRTGSTPSRDRPTAVAEGHFREDTDPEQFAHELYGIMLMSHHATRLLHDPRAAARTRAAFDGLIARARKAAA
jgi:hypothetical protein